MSRRNEFRDDREREDDRESGSRPASSGRGQRSPEDWSEGDSDSGDIRTEGRGRGPWSRRESERDQRRQSYGRGGFESETGSREDQGRYGREGFGSEVRSSGFSGHGRSEYGGAPFARGQELAGEGSPRRSEYGGSPSSYGRQSQSSSSGTYSGRTSRGWSSEQHEQPRGRFSGQGPKGYQRSDDRIKEEISDRLMEDPDIDPSEVEIQVSSGEVTLSGSVDSRETKWQIESLVDEVSGVKDVQNNVRVQRSRSESGSGSRSGSSMSASSGASSGSGSASGSSSSAQGRPSWDAASQGASGSASRGSTSSPSSSKSPRGTGGSMSATGGGATT